ncbi:MAG TPA: lactonase family protein, partial [Chloroflexota bacterium]|nr:lactonase family protein [Chloroflexota bacterium]
YVYRMDPASGALTRVQLVTGVDNPSFLALHPNGRYLYAVEEISTYQGQNSGSLVAFGINPASGALTLLNRTSSYGSIPAHLQVDPSGRYLVVANYVGGNDVVVALQPDGRLGELTDSKQHEGMGPNRQRQEAPHPHMILFDPAGRYVFDPDLGIDKIMAWRWDGANGRLMANELPYGQVSSGAGPRHMAFHPGGRWAYVINELDNTVSVFAYDPERGALQIMQTLSTLPADFSGTSNCAEIMVHPTGRFLYGSNRGHDSLAIFAVDAQTGRLTAAGWEPTQGAIPRNFNIDPSGSLLLAANQNGNNIVPFRVDSQSGRLTPTGTVTAATAPVCLLFKQL